MCTCVYLLIGDVLYVSEENVSFNGIKILIYMYLLTLRRKGKIYLFCEDALKFSCFINKRYGKISKSLTVRVCNHWHYRVNVNH